MKVFQVYDLEMTGRHRRRERAQAEDEATTTFPMMP